MATRPDVEVLDHTFLTERRAQLHAQRSEAARLVDALVAEANGLTRRRETSGAEEGFGRVDTVGVELDRAHAQHAKAVAHLAEVEAAIARVDAGTYGQCQDCGGPIGRERLEALPEAMRCVSCQAHPRRLH